MAGGVWSSFFSFFLFLYSFSPFFPLVFFAILTLLPLLPLWPLFWPSHPHSNYSHVPFLSLSQIWILCCGASLGPLSFTVSGDGVMRLLSFPLGSGLTLGFLKLRMKVTEGAENAGCKNFEDPVRKEEEDKIGEQIWERISVVIGFQFVSAAIEINNDSSFKEFMTAWKKDSVT